MRPLNEYHKGLHDTILKFGSSPKDAVTTFHLWFPVAGRDLFIEAFEHETSLKLRSENRTERALIEHSFPKNINEYQTKTSWDNYYVANALIFLRILDHIFERLPTLPAQYDEIFWHNIHGIVQKLVLDSMLLISDWAAYKHHLPEIIGVGKNRFENTTALYHSALQLIYGNLQPFAFADNHSDAAINQLRMAIELRLRDAFGILAKTDKNGGAVRLALSLIIEAVAEHKGDIDFPVPFEHVERLYGWANIYIRDLSSTRGRRSSRYPIFVLFYWNLA